MTIKLHREWRKICAKAWSFRASLLCAAFSAAEVSLPLLATSMPAGYFSALAFVAAIGTSVARIVAQSDLEHSDD